MSRVRIHFKLYETIAFCFILKNEISENLCIKQFRNIHCCFHLSLIKINQVLFYQVLVLGDSLSHELTLNTYMKKGQLLYTFCNNVSVASEVCKIRIHSTPNMSRLYVSKERQHLYFPEVFILLSPNVCQFELSKRKKE